MKTRNQARQQQLNLDLNLKPKPLTKTEVYNKLVDGDKLFKRGDFFRWLAILEEKGYRRGFNNGVSEGYDAGQRDQRRRVVQSNY